MKTCTRCGEEKPLEDFFKRARNKDGRGAACKPCRAKEVAEYRRKNPEKQARWSRTSVLRARFNITDDEYERLLAEQYGCCAICEKACTTGRRLAVDHNHDTGEVRGLLCSRCNRGIGLFMDDASLLRRAADYLG